MSVLVAELAQQAAGTSPGTDRLWLPLLIAFVLGCRFGAAFQSWPFRAGNTLN